MTERRSMQAHDIENSLRGLRELEFRMLSRFNRGSLGVFWSSGGTSPWERHPDDDELLHPLEGEVDVEVLTDDGPVVTTVRAGSVFVVPRGLWHRHRHRGPLKELYLTPGPSEHSAADDPRREQSWTPPRPDRLSQYMTGHWAAITLATAVQYAVFTRIEHGADTCEALAREASISPRGAQALLDALVGLGLLTVSGARYATTPESSFYLVEGKPAYMGGWADRILGPDGELAMWSELPRAVERGVAPEVWSNDAEGSPLEKLVVALAPGAWPMAQHVAARLGLATLEAPRVLDLGGGAGTHSAAFLLANPGARCTQIERANVNRLARDYVARFGVGERFDTIDGDLNLTDFGDGMYDVVLYSNVAHMQSPDANRAIFRRIRCALKPGGTLVVIDAIMHDDRSGPPFPCLFQLEMLLGTLAGGSWCEADYRSWLVEAGFDDLTVEPTPAARTAIIAR